MNFKVGEWVNLVRCDGVIFDTFQYTEGYSCEDGYFIDPWQPKEGEYILATDGTKAYLVRFLGMNYEKFVCSHLDGFSEAFTKIEPFTSPLPSFIKDK